MALRDVLNRLSQHKLKREGKGWAACCPAHDDKNPSLSIGQGDEGRALVYCQRGCELRDILAALELTEADLFEPQTKRESSVVATYDYRDEGGALLFQVVRMEPKTFRQRRPEGNGWAWGIEGVRRVLYRLPELLAADPKQPVFVVEGEKDADRLAQLRLVATTNPGGAGKWRDEYSEFLRGRRVVLCPDNDQTGENHVAQVSKSLRGVAADVVVLRPDDLPEKGDISDWLDINPVYELQGWAEDLLAQSASKRFVAAADRLDGERAERPEIGRRALSFGVRFLDEALGGIFPNDLVLLGAKSGVGKTALATMVALHNARKGLRVHYFALEAEEREIERRMKYQVVADEYYRTTYSKETIRYQDWYAGRLDPVLGHLDDWADEVLRPALSNMYTFYRFDSFTSDDFARHLDMVRDETDLVVLDHLHYVDNEDDNENRGYKRMLKQIRDSALKAGKPVLLVAHVRKSDRRYEALVPGLEDFHGSSEIGKIPTKAIMIAPVYGANPQPWLWNTYMHVVKNRTESAVTRFTAITVFNARTNSYQDAYDIGRLTDGGKTFQTIPEAERPAWARGAI